MSFLSEAGTLPKPGDEGRAEHGFERWAETAAKANDDGLKAFATALPDDPGGRALLAAIFGNSSWLTQCALHEPETVRRIVEDGPDAAFDEALAAVTALEGDRDTVNAGLRRARRAVALTVGLADIAGVWTVERVTAALSRFADAAVGCALECLLAEAKGRGEIEAAGDSGEGSPLAPRCGIFVLGLGKLGAHELNYSSDIDLIALYDPERLPYTGRQSPQQFAVRVIRDLVAMMENRTRDGYVFRTDLRLRPDPGSTPLAVAVPAAEAYYESTGQNWERAALIKARVIAGDDTAGAAFLRMLTPFLWRKNLDFAAIEDIHSIKRQINAHRGGETIAIQGHNLKLGRGGIREIEFFAQTQQLIWGGRVPELRSAATCDTLAALAAESRIEDEVRDELTAAYRYLRRAEHRLQMIDDRQTHSVPESDEEFAHFATFMGYDDPDALAAELRGQLECVEHHYAHLFEESPTLSSQGNLVFTGGEDDPDTLKTLAEMGFGDGPMICERIRTWHRGRYRATRSARAREHLTELVPALLNEFAKTANPDAAFRNFDAFLAKLPAGVQFFSLLLANPGLLVLIAEIMGSAPRLAASLANDPSLLDYVLTGDFYGELDGRDALVESLAEEVRQARDYEDILDRSRRFANDHKFQVGMRILSGTLDADAAGTALSDLADAILAGLFDVVREEAVKRHGSVPGREMAVIALGKLGGHEITENSDLDLLFIYGDPPKDADGGGETSDGERPISAAHYFARLSQQFITAISAPTAEGKLYEVDMRLRPSGNAGPIAVSLSSFVQYQEGSAWTWEHMALTRARAVAGPADLRDGIAREIHDILTRPRKPETLRDDVRDMRARLARGHPPSGSWDVKYTDGGLIDVEFIAQYLQLAHAQDHPGVLDANTKAAFEKLQAAGALERETAERLIYAGALWRTIQGMLRFTFEGTFDETAAPTGLKSALARATKMEDFDALKREMEETARFVRSTFIDLIGDPSAT